MAREAQTRRFAAHATSTGAATTVDLKATDAATDFIYLKLARAQIITHANGKTSTLQDSSGSPVVFAVIADLTVAAGGNQGGQFVFDFGNRGIKLTQGKKLQVLDQAAGCVVFWYVEGYQRGY